MSLVSSSSPPPPEHLHVGSQLHNWSRLAVQFPKKCFLSFACPLVALAHVLCPCRVLHYFVAVPDRFVTFGALLK